MNNLEKDAKDFATRTIDKGAEKIRDFGNKAKEASENIADRAERIADKATSSYSLSSAGEEAQKMFNHARDEVTQYAEDLYGDVVTALKRNPGQSLIAAVAVGVGLGAIFFRNRS